MPAKSFSSDTTASALGHLPAQIFSGSRRVKSHCSNQHNGKTAGQTTASLIASISCVPLPWPHFLSLSLTHTILGLPRKGRDALVSSHVDKMSHGNKSKGSVGDVGCMLQVNLFTHHLVEPLTWQHLLRAHLTTKALIQRGKLWMIFVQGKISCWHWELQHCCWFCGALLKALKSQCGCSPVTLMSRELHGGVGAISSITFGPLPPACKKGEKFNSGLCANATVKLQFKKSSERGSWGVFQQQPQSSLAAVAQVGLPGRGHTDSVAASIKMPWQSTELRQPGCNFQSLCRLTPWLSF